MNLNSAVPVLDFRIATSKDAEAITALVNSAYRGDSSRAGWTTEADLLTGVRVIPNDVLNLIEADGSLILLCLQDEIIVGSVHLQKTEDRAYLGMFAVNPQLQGGGIGKRFMLAAEDLVKRTWQSQKMWMTVITSRHELIAYYERRGYAKTGKVKDFPAEVPDECRLVKELKMLELEKRL
ncbi:GNAT family N-acetyltransferase [Undibacterium fentianense]|uniref:GNAT family N-acetyltransferase n=1 Tax=Undibacterium fentianense TaxID=2828728 RepID=A0A941E390_9BURK|nr:GNAT family N-acetyltransferase [Undibacterium fentianense]MBR7800676.1 GNAT family N-acetyltransferase [Undibacterium fentianense]